MASFSYETTLPVVHSSQFPARCQGKKPAILTGFRISLMIIAVDRQKLAWLLNENCSASVICVSFSSSCTTQESFIENTYSLWAKTIREKEE